MEQRKQREWDQQQFRSIDQNYHIALEDLKQELKRIASERSDLERKLHAALNEHYAQDSRVSRWY